MSVTDDFERPDAATLGANWTDIVGGCNVASGTARGNTGGVYNWSARTAETWNSNQSSEVTLGPSFAGDSGPIVRAQDAAGGGDGYMAMAHHTGLRKIYRRDNGTLTLLASFDGTIAPGDVIKLTATGSTLEYFRNGVSLGTTTDSTYTGGSPGIYVSTTGVDGAITTWTGTGEVAGGGSVKVHELYAGAPSGTSRWELKP